MKIIENEFDYPLIMHALCSQNINQTCHFTAVNNISIDKTHLQYCIAEDTN